MPSSDTPSLDALRWAAQQTKRMHEERPSLDRAAGRCARCPADGSRCPQYSWALRTLAVLES